MFFLNYLFCYVDGIFVSKDVGTDALAAINIVDLIVNILTGIALGFAVGGSAMSMISIGSNDTQKANREFSVSTIAAILISALVALLIYLNLDVVIKFLGATEATMEYCKVYGIVWLIGVPAVVGKELLTFFIRVDGSPTVSFLLAITGGVTNIILDYIFIKEMGMGIFGAGLATVLGLVLSSIVGVGYLIFKSRILKFTFKKLTLDFIPTCIVNGSSDFISQLAIAITSVVVNIT